MVKRVTPTEAETLLKEGWTYLDVRSIPEFEGGHPAGAVNIPLLHNAGGRMAPNPAFQSVVEGNFPKDAKIVVGCKAGPRSMQAAALLAAAGYANLVEMRGGFHGERDNFGRVAQPGWAECGLPVETSAAPEKTYVELEKRAGTVK
jgi:rhodanese-related sulfurtransferase